MSDPLVYVLYHYVPSLPGAIIFLSLFLLSSVWHSWQAFRSRVRFYIPLVVGAYFEWIGFIGRIMNHNEAPKYTIGPYVLQSVLLLIAPAMFAATIYMTLGRIVRACNAEHHLFIRVNWLTRIFVLGDVFSLLLQSGGAGLLASGSAKLADTGTNIIIAGLVVQILFFIVFVISSILFHVRMNRESRISGRPAVVPWKKHMMALYTASLLIFIRSIYRVIEYVQGNNGYLISTEWCLYVFDSALMLIVLVVFHAVHGSDLVRFLRVQTSSHRDRRMVSEFEELPLDDEVSPRK